MDNCHLKTELWKRILDGVIWIACVAALVLVLLATRGPLEYLNDNLEVSTETTYGDTINY